MHPKLRKSRLRRFLVRGLVLLASPLVGVAIFICRLVPEKLALRMAGLLGALTRHGKRNVVLDRVRLATGEAFVGDAAREFWRAYLIQTGLAIFESVYLYYLTDARMLGRIELSGEAHLTRALEKGSGAVLFLNHFGNPGTIIASLGLRGYDLTIAGNAMVATIAGEQVELTYLERVVQRMFDRGRAQRAVLGGRLPIRLAGVLSRNGLFGMFIDFPVARKHNQLLPFGNAFMEVNLGPAILALRHRCPVLCVTTTRVGDNRHRVTVHPSIELPEGAGDSAAAQLLEAALKLLWSDTRAQPEQWWPWDWAQIVPMPNSGRIANEDILRVDSPADAEPTDLPTIESHFSGDERISPGRTHSPSIPRSRTKNFAR